MTHVVGREGHTVINNGHLQREVETTFSDGCTKTETYNAHYGIFGNVVADEKVGERQDIASTHRP